jgi:hypothetical protein
VLDRTQADHGEEEGGVTGDSGVEADRMGFS